uniref:BTB domain-containing protein n=1 Tax=Panagrolaimus davidi TaxID=227884 RepID=A0A914Q6X1_9BILA
MASSSPIFERIVNENDKTEIAAFDFKIVKKAIKFYYDQDISQFLKKLPRAIELFKFSIKFEMDELKKQLELHFVDILSPANICEITNLAISTKSQKLKDLCSRVLLIFLRESFYVKNFDILNKDFAFEVMQKGVSQ